MKWIRLPKHFLIEWPFCTSFGIWNAKCVIMKCAMQCVIYSVSRSVDWNDNFITNFIWNLRYSIFICMIHSFTRNSRFRSVRLAKGGDHFEWNFLHIVHLFLWQCSQMCVPGNCFSSVALNAYLNSEWLIKCRCCLQILRPQLPSLLFSLYGEQMCDVTICFHYPVHMKLNAFVHYDLRMIWNSWNL